MARRGMGGHQATEGETPVWLTPPFILEALGGADSFDLDPCACGEPRPWPTARAHLTERENGLRRPWTGRVFMNPPYGGPSIIGPWLRRMAAHNDGIALIFARTETELFHELVWRRATGVFFFEGRLFFRKPDGTISRDAKTGLPQNAGAPSCLVAYGADEGERLAKVVLPGVFVPLDPKPLPTGTLL